MSIVALVPWIARLGALLGLLLIWTEPPRFTLGATVRDWSGIALLVATVAFSFSANSLLRRSALLICIVALIASAYYVRYLAVHSFIST